MRHYVGERYGNVFIHYESGRCEPLPRRLDLRMHSPTGFSWGYGGSGPAQLALAILADLLPDFEEKALFAHQAFKRDVIARLPQGEAWTLHQVDVWNWLRAWENKEFDRVWGWLLDAVRAPRVESEEYHRVRELWESSGRRVDETLMSWVVGWCVGVPDDTLI